MKSHSSFVLMLFFLSSHLVLKQEYINVLPAVSDLQGVTIVKPIVFGNVARYFGKKREEDGHTHQWSVYVKPYRNEVSHQSLANCSVQVIFYLILYLNAFHRSSRICPLM